jgi:mycothiol synthase
LQALLARESRRDCQFLLAAELNANLQAAVWAEQFPGRTAVVAAPAGPSVDLAGEQLLGELHRVLRENDVALVQAALTPAQTQEAKRLERGGYRWVADLLYMAASNTAFPDAAWQLPFSLAAFQPGLDEERLLNVIDQTYLGTLDCPALDGLRKTSDVLAGYQAIGAFDPSRWLFVRSELGDVGCLLLAEHAGGQWELVYFGLIPSVRGQGWGIELVRWAMWLARAGGAEQMVLSVDAANTPARRSYELAGFRAWEIRRVFVNSLDASN